MKITFGKYEIDVTARFVKTVHGFPGEKPRGSDDCHNQFRVKILHNGIEKSFLYHGSNKDYWGGKEVMDESDLRNALECIISEALPQYRNLEDFCNEFGYDTDSRRAEKTYLAILKNRAKVLELGFTDDDLQSIYNAMNEDQ